MRVKNIIDIADGKFKETLNKEVLKILKNIIDPSTNAEATRRIVAEIHFKPDCFREDIEVSFHAKSVLAPPLPEKTVIQTRLSDEYGVVLVETKKNLPGQTSFSGDEQEEPALIKTSGE